MRHLTPERARFYDRWVFPWTVRIVGVWILLDAYARPFPESSAWLLWLMDWGETALGQALAIGEHIWQAEWDALDLNGWVGLVLWLVTLKVIKRIRPVYSWPAHRFLSKKATVTVTPDQIAIRGTWFESEAVGQLAVMEHHDAGFHAAQDQARRDAGGQSSGKSFYYQNAFDVVMPYHGQPVILFSIYGNKLAAEQAAARITLVRQLAAKGKAADREPDEFGPSPSLPGDEMP